MIYQIFSIILSALFLMFMFWALWYIAIPLLAVAVLLAALGQLKGHIKHKIHKHRTHHQPIRANDVIDVDFKEVK
ncbi:MAG: hypothetical protein J6T55_03200 [Alphaproteobacteria bacterium]|nr:hypothetical protein [Alphaproteobacteria bacterium]